ncbi:head-tail connector protein [Celeribacter sp.]|uniref:head-tail connector protein n=1 Tax=Celeribacter sp. TaxID=1890673 RepID=UPI003A923B57
MSQISVALLKAHLNLEHDLDDDLLTTYLNAAEQYATRYTGSFYVNVNYPDVQLAVLMLAGFWYENREAAQTGSKAAVVPFGVHDLLQAHRKWNVGGAA